MSKIFWIWSFFMLLIIDVAMICGHHLDISITQRRNMETNDNGEKMSQKSGEMAADTEHFLQNNAKQERFGRIQLASDSSEQSRTDRFPLAPQQDQKNILDANDAKSPNLQNFPSANNFPQQENRRFQASQQDSTTLRPFFTPATPDESSNYRKSFQEPSNGSNQVSFNQKNGSSFDSSRNFNRENAGTQGRQGGQSGQNVPSGPRGESGQSRQSGQGSQVGSSGFGNDYLLAMQQRPMVTKTIQIAQPAIKATTYKIHHPAIQKQYYDIEERVLIKPAGTIVVEFEHPIAKIPTDQTILPLGQLHPLVANEYRNNGPRRISSNTVYSTAGDNTNGPDNNGDSRNLNPYANYPQEHQSQQQPVYPYKNNQYKDSQQSRLNEGYETEDLTDNRSQIDKNTGRLGNLQAKPNTMSINKESFESDEDEEVPAHVQEITSILKSSNGTVIYSTGRSQPKDNANYNDKNFNDDLVYLNPSYVQMRQKPERFGRIRLEETTSVSPRNLEKSSDLPRLNEQPNISRFPLNSNDSVIEKRTEIPPEFQVTVRSDEERPNESRIRITASTQDNDLPRNTGNKANINIVRNPGPEFEGSTFDRTDPSFTRKNAPNRQSNQQNAFSSSLDFNASLAPSNGRKPYQEGANNSNLSNLAKNIAGETLGTGSKVIAVTPAPRDSSLNKESFQSRRIVVNHPFETIREIVEHEPYTNYHEIQVQEPAAPELFFSEDHL